MVRVFMDQAENECEKYFKQANKNVEYNQKRVLKAFQNNRVSDSHFNPTTGYGYDDMGRDVLESVYAEVFGGEDALVRPQIVSGTHAITTALFGLLRPSDELLYITGTPYDTLEEVIGIRGDASGSLKDFGIDYNDVNLLNGKVDFKLVAESISSKTKVIGIQRSKGYDDRPSFTIEEIQEMIDFVKKIKRDVIVFVDNCYGEFVETLEPPHVGADIIAGSLIKNPGGGLVRSGGYIVGKEELILQCANQLTAPGLGKDAGASVDMLQEMYQGFFLAPHIVGESLKGAIFTAKLLELLSFKTMPKYDDKRTDLIQTVYFDTPEQMIAFCQSIQKSSPVNSFVTPIPSEMPGYDSDVIMAGGTFIQGSSIELSADGPIRPPYMAFIQGGLTYSHVKITMSYAVEQLLVNN